ncbi:MAG: glycoside hydrolase family 3 protein [Lachnospiraceae bacterium]|nr:glycoside hydrolase family 3 protein [Lachnospiraceae bacterium]
MNKTGKRQGVYRGLAALMALFLTISIGGGMIANNFSSYIDNFLGTTSWRLETEAASPEEMYNFTSDYSTARELVDGLIDLGRKVSQEGSVLLKNDGALPLASSEKKVTLFGVGAYSPILGGAIGSSASNNDEAGVPNHSLIDALTSAGIEVNPAVKTAYEESGIAPGQLSPSFMPGSGGGSFTITEPALSAIGVTSANVAGYDEVGIVVISRPSSEAADYFPSDVTDETGVAKTPLSFGGNELAAIDFAKETCKKVIVLVNSSSAMEVEPAKQDTGVNAILWIGFPGNYGFDGVVDILTGEVSPSGHLSDTYPVDSTSAPAMVNYGKFDWANGDTITRDSYNNTALRAISYEVEAEGIYTGYRYYETRYADKVNNVPGVGEFDYTAQMSYPFGYGLSYTTFTQTLKSVEWDYGKKTVTAVVEVENTGSVAGKDVVQVYVQTPYTDYDKENLVEKSAIQLIGFGKTQTLQPGAKETVTVEIDAKYFASYDYKNAKTYIMDAGDYYFAIGMSAHDALNNVLASQGKTTENGMDYNGDASKVSVKNVEKLDTTTFAKSENGTAITNQLEDADLNYWMPGTVTYLSRQDWTGTWPKAYTGLSATDDMKVELENRTYEISTTDNVTTEWGVKLDDPIYFSQMKNATYDDPRWETFLSQITWEEAVATIIYSGVNFDNAVPSIEFAAWQAADGPNGINTRGRSLGAYVTDTNSPYYMAEDDPLRSYTCGTMASSPVVASTFSHELAEAFGKIVGNESIWTGVPAWWAPGSNLHRVAYCGRVHEYFSEDPMLSNYISADIVTGGQKYGLVVGSKHFAFNDMEYNRSGLASLQNEQAARENDLRSFQGSYEDAGCMGMMSAFNRIGIRHVNHHLGLMQGILRGEWGFNGIVQTDMVNGSDYFLPVESILGVINYMSNGTNHTEEGGSWEYANYTKLANDAKVNAAVRETLHNTFYTFANSNMMMGVNETTRLVPVMNVWRTAILACQIGFGVLTALALLAFLIAGAKARKERKEEQ